MARTLDPARAEQDARTRFADLGTAPPAVRDDNGVEHSPDARYTEICRRAKLIATSDGLADAVTAHLSTAGIEAEVHQVRADPAEGDEQVMTLRTTTADGTPVLVPLRPGATTLRIYPFTDSLVLPEPPLHVIELPTTARSADGWVDATTIAQTLKAHLHP
ncbi:hypothetical protein [Saccharothrix variisporea]|uniref:Uncharacterized protein n=1 Tax=Saccharothrix variisporea TaxID=543527 RepID=A0A495X890_9PSEU|nr:hypothetical protein [Saccharothrix variisporea]RKT69094.1 hypothetical protein DFJ66_2287 [Saccharothrix variisporea]